MIYIWKDLIRITKEEYETKGFIARAYLFYSAEDNGYYKKYLIESIDGSTGDLICKEV